MTILLILITFPLDYVSTLLGENWFWSFWGFQGLSSTLNDWFLLSQTCPISPVPPVTLTVRFTYILDEWTDYAWPQEPPDPSSCLECKVGIDDLGRLPFGACLDPIRWECTFFRYFIFLMSVVEYKHSLNPQKLGKGSRGTRGHKHAWRRWNAIKFCKLMFGPLCLTLLFHLALMFPSYM